MATETMTTSSLGELRLDAEPIQEATVPAGFPQHLTGAKIWDMASMSKNPGSYVLELTDEDVTSVEQALRHFQGLGLTRGQISKETFPLPDDLSERLKAVGHEMYDGRGFHIVRGIDPKEYNEEQNLLLFAGISSHVAPARSHTIGHIYDATKDEALKGVISPPAMNIAMGFHCDLDGGDIVAMYLQEKSAQGGRNHLCSFWQVYNKMVELGMFETLQALTGDFPFQLRRKDSNKPYTLFRPVMTAADGKVVIHFVKTLLTGSAYVPRTSDAPQMTEGQARAIKELVPILDEHAFTAKQEEGDILFLNNLAVLHAREAFVNTPEATRHILRLYLSDPEQSWENPTADTGEAQMICSTVGKPSEAQRFETKTELQKKGFFSPQCHHD